MDLVFFSKIQDFRDGERIQDTTVTIPLMSYLLYDAVETY